MFKNSKIICAIFGIFLFSYFSHASAMSYLSESYSDQNSCQTDKNIYDQKFPSYSRSDCFESENKYYYNICETNFCTIPDKYIQDSSAEYQSNNQSNKSANSIESNPKIEKFGDTIEAKLENMSEKEIEIWADNFSQVLQDLKEKNKNKQNNIEIINILEDKLEEVTKKQISQNNKCSQKFGEGWQEAETFYTTTQTVEWIEGNVKYSLACKYNNENIFDKQSPEDEKSNETVSDKNDNILSETFRVTSSQLFVKNDWLSFNISFSKNVDSNNIFLRLYNDGDYQETNLKNYMDGDFDYAGWEITQSPSVFFQDEKIHIQKGSTYVLEIYNADENIVLEQYEFTLQGTKPIKISKNTSIKKLFDGNKNREKIEIIPEENYKEFLQPVDESEIHEFVKNAEKEIQSRITQDDKFVYFNKNYAITKKKYYGNQIYNFRNCPNNDNNDCLNGREVSGVCPVGYKLEENSISYNPYEGLMIGYYLNKNKDNYKQNTNVEGVLGNKIVGLKVWNWDKHDQRYAQTKSLDFIKKESQKHTFSTHEFVLNNPGIALRKSDLYNQYHYWTDYGTSEKVGTLLPALCEKIDGAINTFATGNKYPKDLSGVKTYDKKIVIHNSNNEGGSPIFHEYAKAKIKGYFGVKNTQYFLPFRYANNRDGMLFYSKKLQ